MISFGWFYSDEPICDLPVKPKKIISNFTFRLDNVVLNFKGDFSMLLPIDKQILGATVSYTDRAGNPAVVDGVPVWNVDRPDLVSLVVSEDGFAADIVPTGVLGSAQLTVSADADMGDGVKEVITLGSIDLIAGEAVGGVLNFPEPVVL